MPLISLSLILQSTSAAAACQTNELRFDWPMQSPRDLDWVINNYVDLDPSTGLKDYKNQTGSNAKTYNGHAGIDIDLPSFRNMDAHTPVLAAASGTVIEVQDNLFDRNMENPATCAWNHVTIRHANGFQSIYGHLRQGSISVQVGQEVASGQIIAEVGSSGCSSTAHLHFETHDCQNNVVDPFLQGMWNAAPPYQIPMRLMDIVVRPGAFLDGSERPYDALMKDPSLYALTIPRGSMLAAGASLAGGKAGDRFSLRFLRSDGSLHFGPNAFVATGDLRHTYPRWWTKIPDNAQGVWTIQFLINDTVVRTHNVQIQETPDVVVSLLSNQTYQQNFQSLVNDGYKPIWIDGLSIPAPGDGQGAAYTAIFRREGGVFRSYHAINPADYQGIFDAAVAAGLQPTHIDNYLSRGQVQISATFSNPMPGAWRAYHLVSASVHQQKFNELRAQGYRPYLISVVRQNGQDRVSAAYTNQASQGWNAVYGLTAEQYQEEFNRQTAQGRALSYVDVYDQEGTPKFSAIWTVEANRTKWNARHNLSETQFLRENQKMALLGYKNRMVSTYWVGNQPLYAALWSQD